MQISLLKELLLSITQLLLMQKKVIFKNCASFTNYRSEINNTQIDNAKNIDIAMHMYNLVEYSDNYSKTSGRLWRYWKDIPAVDNKNAIVNFTKNNLTDSFIFKLKMASQTGDDETKNVKIMVPLKYLSNFWRTLEMPLINCEIVLFSHGLQIVLLFLLTFQIKMQHLK